jgi:hypothetical protein
MQTTPRPPSAGWHIAQGASVAKPVAHAPRVHLWSGPAHVSVNGALALHAGGVAQLPVVESHNDAPFAGAWQSFVVWTQFVHHCVWVASTHACGLVCVAHVGVPSTRHNAVLPSGAIQQCVGTHVGMLPPVPTRTGAHARVYS